MVPRSSLLQEEHAGDDEPKPNVAENPEPKKAEGDDGAQEVKQAETIQPSVSHKRKHREGTRKPLKASVIRRLCAPHSKRGRPRANGAAEIMYTNPQFSIDSNIHSRSSFNVAHVPSKKSTRLLKSKSRRTPASKAKRRIKSKSRSKAKPQSRRLSARVNQIREASEHHWVCTEINGEIYKVMDLPRGLDDLSCLLLGRPGGKKVLGKRATAKRTERRTDNARHRH